MKIHKTAGLCVCSWLLLLGISVPTRAQTPASSFEELRSTIKLGESVQITDDSGKKFKAKLTEIHDGTITVNVNGAGRDLSESAVLEIRRTHRNVKKGLLIGLGAGIASYVALLGIPCAQTGSDCTDYPAGFFLGAFAGLGAGSGAAIGFAIPSHKKVFARPSTSNNRGLTISPIISKDNTGAKLSFSF